MNESNYETECRLLPYNQISISLTSGCTGIRDSVLAGAKVVLVSASAHKLKPLNWVTPYSTAPSVLAL